MCLVVTTVWIETIWPRVSFCNHFALLQTQSITNILNSNKYISYFLSRCAQSVGVPDPDAEVRRRRVHHGVPVHVPAAGGAHAAARDDAGSILRPHAHKALQKSLPGEFG